MSARCLAIVVIVAGCGRISFDLHDPVPVECTPAVVADSVGAGLNYTCARATDGTLSCWGDGNEGQLANGLDASSMMPVAVSLTGVRAFATGIAHACAISNAGLACWGRNQSGELGLGDGAPRSKPTAVTAIPGEVIGVAAGGINMCAWNAAGELWCAGRFDGVTTQSTMPEHVLGVPRAVDASLASLSSVGSASGGCMVGDDGSVWCWGVNDQGQLGTGTAAPQSLTPVQVVGITDAARVAYGAQSICASTHAGAVYCWGGNDLGQLGDGTTTRRALPMPAHTADVTAISARDDQMCALHTDGSIECWGQNRDGALGIPESGAVLEPTRLDLPPAQSISVGGDHACAVSRAGVVWCWGGDDAGQLGDGPSRDRTAPLDVDSNAIAMVSGADHACALHTDNKVYCWGGNAVGQLGDGTVTSRQVPTAAAIDSVVEVSSSSDTTCARRQDGGVWCWGGNASGQALPGRVSPQLLPVQVTLPEPAATIAAGGNSACAAGASGTVYCWGSNAEGQLGLPMTTPSPAPPMASNFPALAVMRPGRSHECGLTSDGRVFCSGRDNEKQIGDPVSNNDTYAPYQVMIAISTSVATGDTHSCAVVGGTVDCWGDNLHGAVGDGSATNRDVTPLPVTATSVWAGGHSTCVLDASNRASCWGSNTAGQLGDGTTTIRRAPTRAPAFDGSTQITLGHHHGCGLHPDGTVRCVGSFSFGPISAPVPARPAPAAFSCPKP